MPNIYNLANFRRATLMGHADARDSMRNVLPINMMAIAMGCTYAAASRTTSGPKIARAKWAREQIRAVSPFREFGARSRS
jgi:hypothetical protein